MTKKKYKYGIFARDMLKKRVSLSVPNTGYYIVGMLCLLCTDNPRHYEEDVRQLLEKVQIALEEMP